jgi:triacylglycerol lipase
MKMNDVINSTLASGAAYAPIIDGDFTVAPAATQLKTSRFVHVPLLPGCKSDEGTGFGGFGYNTTSQIKDAIESEEGLNAAIAQDFLILYPDIPNIGVPSTYPGRPNGTYGLQFKRASALFGDIVMHAPRRWTAMQWVKNGAPAYTYRFNVVVSLIPTLAFAVLLT